MEGASAAGDITARARAAFAAGCDMALVCKRPDLAEQLLAELMWPPWQHWPAGWLVWLARQRRRLASAYRQR